MIVMRLKLRATRHLFMFAVIDESILLCIFVRRNFIWVTININNTIKTEYHFYVILSCVNRNKTNTFYNLKLSLISNNSF